MKGLIAVLFWMCTCSSEDVCRIPCNGTEVDTNTPEWNDYKISCIPEGGCEVVNCPRWETSATVCNL